MRSHVDPNVLLKSPDIRNMAATAPYMHDGRFQNLESVVAYYRNPADPVQGRHHELPKLNISDVEAHQLVQFLKSLSIVSE